MGTEESLVSSRKIESNEFSVSFVAHTLLESSRLQLKREENGEESLHSIFSSTVQHTVRLYGSFRGENACVKRWKQILSGRKNESCLGRGKRKKSTATEGRKGEGLALVKMRERLSNWCGVKKIVNSTQSLSGSNQRNKEVDISLNHCSRKATSTDPPDVKCCTTAELNKSFDCYRYKGSAAMSGREQKEKMKKNGDEEKAVGGDDEQSSDLSEAQPSTSRGCSEKKKKKKQLGRPLSEGESSEPEAGPSRLSKKKVSRRKTSTPVKRAQKKNSGAPRRNYSGKFISKAVLEAAKVKLDEGRLVELSPDSSFEGPNAESAELQLPNVGSNEGPNAESAELQPQNVGEDINNSAIGFDTLSTSVLNELRMILSEISSTEDSLEWEGSDPNITDVLVGLVGEDGSKLANPFELADRVRRELISRAEEAGGRALHWDMSLFNNIGGSGTLTAVWNSLKSNEKVGGKKRDRSWNSSEDSGEEKKFKLSLNMSGTCDRIAELELSNESNKSIIASFLDCSRAGSEHENEHYRQERSLSVVLAEDESEDGSGGRAESEHENVQYQQRRSFAVALAGDIFEVDSRGRLEREVDVVYADMVGDNQEQEGSSDEDFQMSPTPSSLPDLTQSDNSWSENEDSSQDSGVSDNVHGNVTDLCRSHRGYRVESGVITETGPFIPVSLGLSGVESEESWEELCDEEGRSTGVEIRTFRLNVVER